jgi:hypothetical protein
MGLRLNNSYFRLSNGIFRSVEPVISSGGVVLSYTISELLTTAGAGTWTKPAGITEVTVECWGGGGAGGGATSNPSAGAGGGGGQYARSTITYSSTTQNISYNVAAGGTASTGAGGSGGDSTWATSVVIAKGGTGGEANAVPNTFIAGGVGNIAGSVGDVVYFGGNGRGASLDAVDPIARSAGGGGGAGSTQEGGGAEPLGVPGTGSAEFGGNGGAGFNNVSSVGGSGFIYGGGGGGGCANTNTDRAGGSGAQGLIRVSYSVPPPLDIYTGSTAAFSVRKLTASASFCMKVRRSNDNATQDIGFQDDGLIDTGSLLSFVGSNTGFVNVWYNQANDTDNAIVPPATTIQEPYIVLNGSLMTMNGKPAVFYNALAGIFSTFTKLTDASGLWSTYAVGQVADTTTRLMVRTNTGAVNIGQNIRRNGTNIEAIGFNTAGGSNTDLGPSNPGTSQFVAYSQRTAANVEVYVNGATNGATTVTGTPQISTGSNGAVFLGFFGGAGPPTFPWTGSIQEVIHYAQSPTTFDYRTNLTSQINSFYGTF